MRHLRDALPSLERTNHNLDELRAHVVTLEVQVTLQQPNNMIVREALKTVRNVLEGMTGSVLASGLLQQVQALLR